jgi:radical SAM-linked protein
MVRHRVRIRFRKEGDLRLLGHRDLARVWERVFRRAGIALRMSEGFHPKPRMVFASALAMGVIGVDEALEVELASPCSAEELSTELPGRLPEGLSITSIELVPADAPATHVERVTFELNVPPERQTALAELLHASPLAGQTEAGSSPSDGPRGHDVLAYVERIELTDGLLRFTSRVTPQGTTRPRELLAWLGLADLDEQGIYLRRTAVELVP